MQYGVELNCWQQALLPGSEGSTSSDSRTRGILGMEEYLPAILLFKSLEESGCQVVV